MWSRLEVAGYEMGSQPGDSWIRAPGLIIVRLIMFVMLHLRLGARGRLGPLFAWVPCLSNLIEFHVTGAVRHPWSTRRTANMPTSLVGTWTVASPEVSSLLMINPHDS